MALNRTVFIILLVLLGLSVISHSISYLEDRSIYNFLFSLFYLYLFVSLIISVIFSYKKYYNKKLFQSLGVVILGLTWILVYIIFPMGEDIKLFVVLVVMSLLFLYLIYYLPKEWKKAQKELKEHEVME